MTRFAAAFDTFLRVLLSVALVTTFTPVPRDAVYAAEGKAALADDASAEPSDGEVSAGSASNAIDETTSDKNSGQSVEADAEATGGELSTTGTAAEAPTDPESANADEASATSQTPSEDPEASAQYEPDFYAFGKLMPNGYVYECDGKGNLVHPYREDVPQKYAIDPFIVGTLVVDAGVTKIKDGFLYDSWDLTEVRFEGDSLTSIGDGAFEACRYLKKVDFSGMTINRIGSMAFYGCVNLAELVFDEPATIKAMDFDCFAQSGLVSTGLEHVRGLKSIPSGAYRNCVNLVDTGLARNQEIATVEPEAFSGCTSLRSTGLESNTSVKTLGSSCFEGAALGEFLILPADSKIEQLPKRAFLGTGVRYAYFLCDHAVLIDQDTFPITPLTVYVPASVYPLYEEQPTRDIWKLYNGALPISMPERNVVVSYSQTIDLGGRTLMEGVELPDVSGTAELGEDGQVVLDAGALGMLDDDVSFAGWYDAATGALLSEDTAYSFAPAASMSIEARFKLKDFAVRVNPAQATDASEEYAHLNTEPFAGYRDAGEAVKLSAVASNAHFLGWYVGSGGDAYVASDSLVYSYVVAPADAREGQIDITPKYCAEQASVVLGVDGTDEDGNPAGQFLYSGLYGIGSRVAVVAIPAAGYVLDRVTDSYGNMVPVESDGSYSFLLTGDTQLIAHFRATDDGDEAFEALQAALIAALTLAGVLGTMYGLGELIDPIVVPAIAEVGAAESVEELAAIGEEALGEIKNIFDEHKKKPHDPDNPDKPHGDHKIEVIAVAEPSAGGSAFGGGVHYEGTVAEFQAVPNPGWRFKCWMKNGVEFSTKPMTSIAITDATPEVVNMVAVFESDVQITTSIEVEGVAADFSTGCNASPDVQLPKRGEQVAVVATEGDGYAFVGWFENGVEVSKTQTYGFVAESDRHLVAKFRKADKTIRVNVEPAEAGEVLCDGMPVEGGVVRAKDGDILTFAVRANARPGDDGENYKLVEWRETDAAGRVVVNRQDICEYRVDGNATITAVMDGNDSHTVRAKSDPVEGGTAVLERASGAGVELEVPEGESVTAHADAAEGYMFDGWYMTYGAAEAATFASNEPSYTFVPAADCTVEARFAKACKIAVVVEPVESLAGEYTVSGAGWCVAGEPATLSVELSAGMRDGYKFKGWYDAETGLLMGTDPSYLEFYPQEDTTVRAVFDASRCTIEANTESHAVKRGSVEIVGSPGASAVTVDYGTTVVLRAKPADGFQLKYWKNAAGVKFAETELAVRATKSDVYTAVFESAKPDVVVAADSWLGGAVTCNGAKVTPTTDGFKLGETLHLSAKAYPGYIFYGWYVNGKFRSILPEYTIVAKGAFPNPNRCSIVAAFKPIDIVCMPTANPECGGSVQASRIVTERGTDVALKATAAPGYEFVGWYDLDGKLESADAEFTCEHQQRSHIHEARFEERSYAVSAVPAVVDDAGALVENRAAGWVEGSTTVSAGGSVELCAHAFEGYAFEYWADEQGNAVSEEAEYRFVPTRDTRLRAVFSPKQCTVAISADDVAGSVSGAGTYAAGQVATVSATPKAGAKFLGWYSGGEFRSADATYRFTISGDVALEAAFSMGACAVGVAAEPAEAGYVSGFGGYAEGERATLSAAAKPGFTFDHWEDALGNEVGASEQCTVVVSEDAVYKACFTRNSYGVSLSSNVEGVGDLSGEGTYSFGQVVELNAVPTNDKRFAGWWLVGDDGRATQFALDAHCWFAIDEDLVASLDGGVIELQARFADPYEVAVSAIAVVKGKKTTRRCSVEGGGAFALGDQVTLHAVAGIGYRFVGWSLDEKGERIVDTNEAYTFAASQDITYYAQFEADEQVKITVERSSMFRGMVRLLGEGGLETERLYDKGDLFVAMAMPWTGYRFSHWVNDAGTTVSYSATYIGTANQTEQLTAIFYENGYDAQTNTYPAEAALISMVIPGTGTTSVPVSTLITIPLPGWKFKYWADENGRPIAFSPVTARPVWGNRTFTAYYERESFDVVAVDSRAGGHIEGSLPDSEYGYVVKQTVENGTSCTLRAVADDGYVFDGWYEYGDDAPKDAKPLSTDVSWTFAPDGDVAVEARFADAPSYEVTATAENGTVEPASASVKAGGSATFAAEPNGNCYLESVALWNGAAGAASAPGEPIELDISDYAGGKYSVTLNDVAASQTLAFAFADAGIPAVLAQPQDATIHSGDSAMLSIVADAAAGVCEHAASFASGEPAASYSLSYQWYRVADGQGGDVPIVGATSPELRIASAHMADAGKYYCRITQEYLGTTASVDSERATLAIVNESNFVFNGGTLGAATAHEACSIDVPSAAGGSIPYAYTLAEGSDLPRGLSLVNGGKADGTPVARIEGIPEETGTFNFDLTCTDGAGEHKTSRFTLVVKPKAAGLEFVEGGADGFTYSGKPQAPELSGVPEGFANQVEYRFIGTGETRYSGDAAPPVDAGTYRVVATLNADGYVGVASAAFEIKKAAVTFDIKVSNATYDGNAHGATVDPRCDTASIAAGDYTVTYRGEGATAYGPASQAPIDSGSYSVTVQATNPNVEGSAEATFEIAKAPQYITGTTRYTGTYGDAGIAFDNVAKTPVSFEVVQSGDGGTAAAISINDGSRYATVNAAGTARVVARAPESRNYFAADAVELSVSIAPAQLLVSVDDAQRMQGEANPEFTSSLVSRADTKDVEVTYSCDADENSPAGTYAIGASVANPNFIATVRSGTLTVVEKPKYQVTATAENGTVDPASAMVVEGDSVTFAAEPNENCYLESVTLSNAASGENVDDARLTIGENDVAASLENARALESGVSTNDTAAFSKTGASNLAVASASNGSVELDISDYAGGGYSVTLGDVAAPQALAFAFAEAAAPAVIAQPQGASVHSGDAAVLSVAADADAAVCEHAALFAAGEPAAGYSLSYQWYRAAGGQGEGEPIAGATGPKLRIESTGVADAGEYYCRVTQSYLGTITSADTERARVEIVGEDTFIFNGGNLPAATAHERFDAVVEPAAGGSLPYVYKVDEANERLEQLGLGIAFGVRYEANGVQMVFLEGTPGKTGAFDFDLACTDGTGETKTAHFTLVVKPKAAGLEFTEGGADGFAYSGEPQAPRLEGVPDGLSGLVKYRYVGMGETRYSGDAAPTDAGTYRVVATLNADGYIGGAVATFKITPAGLFVRVHDAERFEGEENPQFESSLESDADTSEVEVDYSCAATKGSPAGTYAIGASVANPNFEATVIPGTLTVKKKSEPVDPDNPGPNPSNPDPDNPSPDNPDPDNPGPDNPDPDEPGPDNPDPGDPDDPDPGNPSEPDTPSNPGNPENGSNEEGDSNSGRGQGDSESSAAPASDQIASKEQASANNTGAARDIAETVDRTSVLPVVALGFVGLSLAILAMRRIRSRRR